MVENRAISRAKAGAMQVHDIVAPSDLRAHLSHVLVAREPVGVDDVPIENDSFELGIRRVVLHVANHPTSCTFNHKALDPFRKSREEQVLGMKQQ